LTTLTLARAKENRKRDREKEKEKRKKMAKWQNGKKKEKVRSLNYNNPRLKKSSCSKPFCFLPLPYQILSTFQHHAYDNTKQ